MLARETRTRRWVAAVAAVVLSAHAWAGTTLFEVTSFADPPWSLTYFDGFSGTIGSTPVWPGEMGWQGDRIDIAFALGDSVPPDADQYRFHVLIDAHYAQSFDLAVLAGPSLEGLVEVHRETVDTPRAYVATIPLARFTPGQTNYIRLQGIGVQVGPGEPSGVGWSRWTLSRTDAPGGELGEIRSDQLVRLTEYVVDAIQPSGLVRDSLPLNPADAPFHPASPDAGGFALLALCAADRLHTLPDAEARVEAVLSAYSGHTPGVTPTRNTKGHWWHWMNVQTGLPEPGWNDNYTTIGSALLVSGALFARNHFVENATIAAYAGEMQSTTNFNAMIHGSLDGRVFLATDANGNAIGTLGPWNEYMLIVSLALRETNNSRAVAVAPKWLDPANAPKISYSEIEMLTDDAGSYAPAFWVQQAHFFNTDFASHGGFEGYARNQQRADALYCADVLAQPFRYGLTAGVDPTGYFADAIGAHHSVYGPEAVAAWGDVSALLDWVQAQPPTSDARYRYGLVRMSSAQPSWIPFDTGLVDHLFLMFGLVESVDPMFFRQRQPFQADADGDGIADAYDNCPSYNPAQLDRADANCDGSVNGFDIGPFVARLGGATPCGPCAGDVNGDGSVNGFDIEEFIVRLGG